MKNLIIIGAGGFGREVHAWASQHPDCGRAWRIAGFLDDDPSALDGFHHRGAVLAGIADYSVQRDDCFTCAIGDPAVRKKICGALLDRGAEFIRLVHPTAVLGANVRLGQGVVVCPYATLTVDVRLGDFVIVNCHSTVGHDAQIGAWSTLSGHCDVTGQVRVGESVFLGSGARVTPGRSVGAGAVVGAGSVVIRSVREGQKVFGNPAMPFA